MGVRIMPIGDLHRETEDVIDAIRHKGDTVYVTQMDRPVVVLVDYESYKQLLDQLQDLSDQLSLEAADDEPARPYSDFAVEMGLPTTLNATKV